MITPTRTQWIWSGVALAVPIVIAIIVLSIPKHGTIPEREQRSLDSMRVTKPAYEASRDTLIQRETVFVRRVDTLVRQAKVAVASAEMAHRQADSLAVIAQRAHDTASTWHAAYTARTLEADSLRSALTLTFAAETTEHHARVLADARADAADMRVTALTSLNERLATDVKNATQCKFLWMRCPSRESVGLTALAVGAIGGYLAHSSP